MVREKEAAVNLPSAVARKTPGGVSHRGAALLADLKLMHPYDQGVISTLGVDVQMQLGGLPRPKSWAHLLLLGGCPVLAPLL